MRTTAPTPVLLFFAFTAALAGWIGCGSTIIAGTGGGASVAGTGGSTASVAGTGGSTASAGPTPASSSISASSASSTSTVGAGGGSACGAGEKACNGTCVSAGDPAYGCTQTGCVPCTTYPNASAACMAGACALGACDSGFKNCDGDAANGCETDIQTDPANCGACGAVCAIPNAPATCVMGTCPIIECNSGWTLCGTGPDQTCVDIQNDPMNCGGCGNVCVGQDQCSFGMCDIGGCTKGTADCPGDPPNMCATVLGTNKNCNFCGDTCNLANALSQCQPNTAPPPAPNHVCTLQTCNPGFANCDMIAANGCETSTSTDANNCGSCGNVCPSGPHSTAVCNGGACSIACDPGYLDCDQSPSDGCEVNGGADTANCGACGAACTEVNGTAVCSGGTCQFVSCNPGFTNCDGKSASGCDVDISTDPNNCGACGNVCTTPNGPAPCVNGACELPNCPPHFADCDGNPLTVCETNLLTSTANCGTCGNACDLPNATSDCNQGQCAIASCNPGFANCDGSTADGCEVNVQTDSNNCGGCGVRCVTPSGPQPCVNGMCELNICTPGFADCDGNPATGCETNINNDPNNCGSCGHQCSTPTCSGGVCM